MKLSRKSRIWLLHQKTSGCVEIQLQERQANIGFAAHAGFVYKSWDIDYFLFRAMILTIPCCNKDKSFPAVPVTLQRPDSHASTVRFDIPIPSANSFA